MRGACLGVAYGHAYVRARDGNEMANTSTHTTLLADHHRQHSAHSLSSLSGSLRLPSRSLGGGRAFVRHSAAG